VGGGLANTLIALRLSETQPKLNFLLLEQDDKPGGNHTWSFHAEDLTAAQHDWIQPLISYRWSAYEVRFPGLNRQLDSAYFSITSESLAAIASEKLGSRIRTGTRVKQLFPDHVVLEDGTELTANAVIDGRGPSSSPHLDVRFQKFVGQVVQLENRHELERPVIMDATSTQDDGYRFFYTLPFTDHTLLIEDTRYSDTPGISTEAYADEIRRYAAEQGWSVRTVLREEEGVLPITLGGDINAYWNSDPRKVPRSGLRAALFHPATGYSLPNAMRLADKLAENRDWTAANVYRLTRRQSETLWAQTRFYRILNRMLFLAAKSADRRVVLERFYRLSPKLIGRFYAGRSNIADKLRILIGKPPVPLSAAWKAVFGYRR
jgi:lycopene beta-cyclase